MADITLKLSKKLFIPKFFPLLFDYSHRWEVYMGSAGSAKSYFITQKIIARCCNEKIKVMVCRQYGTTIRDTCFSLFKDILADWKLIPNYAVARESDFNIKFINGSEIIFKGLDKETKLLSLNNVSVIFIEEAVEVSKDVVDQLNLRLRGKAKNKQILIAFNPISKNHWLYDFCEKEPPNSFLYTHSTYKDNPFLDKENYRALEEMALRNPAKYRVFGLGQWGVDAEGLVFQNWRAEEFDAMELAAKGLEIRNGMDLGWVDKSAIISSLYDRANRTIYIYQEFYKSGCQLKELASAIKDMGIGKSKIYVDAAEPRSIQYFKNEGINATASAKGKDSVKAGIMFMQDHLIIVHPSCKNMINELENFSYIKSKITGEYTENTTHEFSHAIDACRYGYADIYTNKKMKTISKAALGL